MKNIFNDTEEAPSNLEMTDLPSSDELDKILESVGESEEEMEEVEEQVTRKAPVKKTNIPAAGYKLNQSESSIVQIAMVQLEQARLYEMLLKHDLFEGVKVNQSARGNVEKELKDFILERLQILLGMKSEKKTEVAQPQKVKVELPFNDTEIDFLKALAFKGTKGESAKSPSTKMIESQSINTIKPLKEEAGGLNKMNSLSSYSQEEEEYEEEEEIEVKAPAPRRQVQKQAPVQQQSTAPRTVDEIAKEDIKRMAQRKPAHLMSADELMEANKKIKSGKSGKSNKAIPMPSVENLAMHYQQQQLSQNSGRNDKSQLMGLLSKKLGFNNGIQQVGDDE